MATISITVSDAFVTAVQAEAAIDGVGAQAWAKAAIKEAILARRLARTSQTAEATKVAAVNAAVQTAEAQYNATVEADRAAIEGLS